LGADFLFGAASSSFFWTISTEKEGKIWDILTEKK
jgi:hypothetical protein